MIPTFYLLFSLYVSYVLSQGCTTWNGPSKFEAVFNSSAPKDWNITQILALKQGVCPPRSVTKTNQWEIQNMLLQRHNWSMPLSNMGALFTLYRTSPRIKCNWDLVSGTVHLLAGDVCDGWAIRESPIQCVGLMDGWSEDTEFELKSRRNTTWFTCDKYLRAVAGEETVPEERKQWLRWRLFDLQERTPPAPTSTPTPVPNSLMPGGVEVIGVEYPSPFHSAKLEIVNGVPITNKQELLFRFNSTSPMVTVFTAIHNLSVESKNVKCEEMDNPNSGSKSRVLYGCTLNCSFPQVIFGSGCGLLVNVTETAESLSEWKNRFAAAKA